MSDFPGVYGEWTLRPRVMPSLKSKAEVSLRRAGALTLSRKSHDGLVFRRGRSREDVGPRESDANLSVPRSVRELNSYVS